MNFDKSLRAAMPAAQVIETLDDRISTAISSYSATRRKVRRTVSWSAASLAAVVVVVLFPIVSAQAALSRIAGALDGVSKVVIKRYNVDDHGHKSYAGMVAFDNGKWRLEDGAHDLTLYANGNRYTYVAATKCYIVEPAEGPFTKSNGDIRLSSLISQTGGWGNDVDTSTVDFQGKKVKRAIVTSRELPERYTIYADLESDLPLAGYAEGREAGVWRTVSTMEFAYGTSIDRKLFVPDHKIRKLTRSAFWKEIVKTMTSVKLATFPLKDSQLIIRHVDVSEDGTVFVVFQTGARFSGWRGNALTVEDDLGTTYTPSLTYDADANTPWNSNSAKNGGRIEFEELVPTKVEKEWKPRTISIRVHVGEQGQLVRMVKQIVKNPDGSEDKRWSPNYWGNIEDSSPKTPVVYSAKIANPTCKESPEILRMTGFGYWRDDTASRMEKVRARSVYFMDRKEYADAKFWLNKQLEIMREIERQGGGPYSRDHIMKDLQTIERQTHRR